MIFLKKLENKVAVITGGAMGNGLGIVKTFLKYGAKVIVLDYSEEIKDTNQKLKDEFPDSDLSCYQIDIRDKNMVASCIEEIINQYSCIDILVNNAGVCKLESFINMDDDLRDFHFDINIKGTWNVTKAVLPFMQDFSSQGSIINLSSVTGPMVADSGEVAYATTKAAILGFTKALAIELAEKDIRVNAIMPGYIMTPMVEKMSCETNPEHPQDVISQIAQAIPMRRLGTIEELGELTAFLASSESSYITGQGIVIDGGSTLPETNSMGI